MKGRSVSRVEKRFHDALCSVVGCIACRLDGATNFHVSIHHVFGRTKPGAHLMVLPLCAGHHQDGSGASGLVAVHPWKRRFESAYGAQIDLVARCCDWVLESVDVGCEAASAARWALEFLKTRGVHDKTA